MLVFICVSDSISAIFIVDIYECRRFKSMNRRIRSKKWPLTITYMYIYNIVRDMGCLS
jgi:hypothetical protein